MTRTAAILSGLLAAPLLVVKDPGRGLGDAAARSALAHFRFSPPRVDGKPVATWWPFVVRYELPRR